MVIRIKGIIIRHTPFLPAPILILFARRPMPTKRVKEASRDPWQSPAATRPARACTLDVQILQLLVAIRRTLDIVPQVLLENGADIDLDGLVRAPQSRGEICEVLTMIYHRLAQELEGDNTCLAIGLGPDSLENCSLVHIRSDLDNVASWLEYEIIDIQGTNFFVTDKVGECDIALCRNGKLR